MAGDGGAGAAGSSDFDPTSDAVLAQLVHDVGAVMFVLGMDGRFLYLNEASAHLLGHDPAYLIGESAFDHIHPDDAEIVANAMADLLVADRMTNPWDSPALEVRFRLPDGGWRNIEVAARHSQGLGVLVGAAVRAEYRRHIEQFVQRVARLAPVDELLASVVALLDGEVPHGSAGISYGWNGVAFDHVVSALPPVLTGGTDDDGTAVLGPWVQAIETGELVTASGDDLPPVLRDLAARHGMVACWCQRIDGPGVPAGACTVVWRARDTQPVFMQRVAFGHVADLVSLAFERRAHQEQLQHAATHDPLTGLANRSQLLAGLERALADGGSGATLLFIDLDHFKPVNDAHGHAAGDAVLCEVGARLRGDARPGDLVGRLGGDEFAVVVPERMAAPAIEALAERTLDLLGRPVRVGAVAVSVGATIGVAASRPGERRVEDLLDAADRALYEGKVAGRRQWRLALG